jgi:hypothetical protein
LTLPPPVAATISVGFLGAADTYLTATAFPVPIWVTFIAWASFSACSGADNRDSSNRLSPIGPVIIASICLLAIHLAPAHPIFAAVFVGLGTSLLIAISAWPLLDFPPAIVFGFASLVGTCAADDTTIDTLGVTNPTLAMTAMLLGSAFGYLSELGTHLLAQMKPTQLDLCAATP